MSIQAVTVPDSGISAASVGITAVAGYDPFSPISELTTPQTASTYTIHEGGDALTFALGDLLTGLGSWNSINPTGLTAKMQYSGDSGANWTDLGALGWQGLLRSEIPVTSDIDAGEVEVQLNAGSIEHDFPYTGTNRFRVHVEVEDDSGSLVLLIPLNIHSEVRLADLTSPQTADPETIHEGGSTLTLDLPSRITGIADWEDIHATAVRANIQRSGNDGVDWFDLDATGWHGLLLSEIPTSADADAGEVAVALNAGSIDNNFPHDGENRFRVHVEIDDAAGTTFELNIPLNLHSLIALSSITSPINADPVTVHEGGGAVTLSIVDLIAEVDSLEDIHLTDLQVKVQYSGDSGANWTDLGVLGWHGLLLSEIPTSADADTGEVDIEVNAHSIDQDYPNDGTNRFRLQIRADD